MEEFKQDLFKIGEPKLIQGKKGDLSVCITWRKNNWSLSRVINHSFSQVSSEYFLSAQYRLCFKEGVKKQAVCTWKEESVKWEGEGAGVPQGRRGRGPNSRDMRQEWAGGPELEVLARFHSTPSYQIIILFLPLICGSPGLIDLNIHIYVALKILIWFRHLVFF